MPITADKLRKHHTGEELEKQMKILQKLCGHPSLDWSRDKDGKNVGKCVICEKQFNG